MIVFFRGFLYGKFKRNTIHGLCRDEVGSELVEFAISISTLLTVVVSIASGALLLYADHYVANAAREGARYAMVRGSGWNGVSCASAQSYSCTASSASVKTFLMATAPPGLTSANINVVATWPGTTPAGAACYAANGAKGVGCSVQVSVTYTFNLSLPLLPKLSVPLSSTSTMPITQ